jgi:hypothetical protein
MVFPSETAAPRLVAVREEIETSRITTTPTSTTPTNTLETIFDSAPHNPSKSASDADEEIPADAKRDGVTKRLKIPSWDDIMFGSKSDNKSDNSSNKDAE